MNKIIKGKRYNTETAELIGTYENNEPEKSDLWVKEELYRKRTGEFFLVCQGGALTEYGIISVNGTDKPGEELDPITAEYAAEWCEENLTGDEYEKIFGSVEEDGSRGTLSVTLPNTLITTLRENAQKEDKKLSAYVEKIIEKEINK